MRCFMRSMACRPAIAVAAVIVAVPLSLASCGGLEWSTPGYIPGSNKSSEPSRSSAIFVNATAVTVGKGDTIYALSRRHQVSARDIIVANSLKAPYTLKVGQRIVLPRGQVHNVKKNETLYAISRQYDVNVYDLARSNAIKPPYTIYVGQELRLPGTGTRSTVLASAEPAGGQSTTQSTSSNATKTVIAKAKPLAAVPAPPKPSGKGFLWPAKGKVISGFGAKEGGLRNDGINIAAARGAPVNAAENGVVAYAGNELRGFGNLLLVKHANGYISAYAHNDKLLVKRGDTVKKGQSIATVGSTGSVSTPQLHFELRKGKKALDPRKHLPSLSA